MQEKPRRREEADLSLEDYRIVTKRVDKHNEDYVSHHLEEDREYLDKVLAKDDPNILLDE